MSEREGGSGLFLSLDILGATVMPHSLFLGSGLVQSRLKDFDVKNGYFKPWGKRSIVEPRQSSIEESEYSIVHDEDDNLTPIATPLVQDNHQDLKKTMMPLLTHQTKMKMFIIGLRFMRSKIPWLIQLLSWLFHYSQWHFL